MPNLIDPNDPLLANLDFATLDAEEQAQVNALSSVATIFIERISKMIFPCFISFKNF